MTGAYRLSPEVPGMFGANTVLDTSGAPPVVHRLDYVFLGWLGDELIETYPIFMASQRLADYLTQAGVVGPSWETTTVRLDPQFVEYFPEDAAAVPPEWLW